MPKKPIDYTRTIIYKLVCKNPNIKECYVGATTDFTKRKYRHKNSCINTNCSDYSMKVYQFIRDNGTWDNWDMVMIEEYKNCNNKLQSGMRERYWLETLQSTLNTIIPSRTKQEWTEINKDNISNYQKEWYNKNKDKTLIQHQLWKQNNKEKIKINSREYYNNNKDKINEIIKCECGSECVKYGVSRHYNSKKHINFLNSLIVV